MAAGNKAYSIDIKPNGSDGIHSVSPSWVITFLRWENRFINSDGNEEGRRNFLATRRPFVVENDCASLSITSSKSSHTPSFQAMLYPGDINYLTAIAPGDFAFVNILNWESDARKVADAARQLKPINTTESGFKGLFKVQSVRRVFSIDPASGKKRIMFQVTGYAFTEFNNTLYFNPFLISAAEANNQFLFVTRITQVWEQYVGKKGIFEVQEILRLLINATIGDGLNNKILNKKENLQITENTHFYIPQEVGKLLGVPEARAAKDIYNYLFGIQKYSVPSQNQKPTLAQVLNPNLSNRSGRFLFTPQKVQGASPIKPEYWNQVTVWSILNQYTNAPINELYTAFRVDPDGFIMPTVVFRQIPFTTEEYKGLSNKFFNLPRWKIDPELLLDINVGREESARFNFVQVFATVPQAADASNKGFISQQIAAKNFVVDKADIIRSGLKPYIKTSNFDEIITDKEATRAPTWAKLLADAVFGSHLKLNGSISTYGIVEPITPGDNLELDSVVYHIESITHNCTIQPDGRKSFSTNVELSNGLDVESEKGQKVFPQMRNVDIQKELKEEYDKGDAIFPGIVDEQAIPRREGQNQGKNTTDNNAFPILPGVNPPPRRKK